MEEWLPLNLAAELIRTAVVVRARRGARVEGVVRLKVGVVVLFGVVVIVCRARSGEDMGIAVDCSGSAFLGGDGSLGLESI